MSSMAINLTVLCVCGQPANAAIHGDGHGQHRYIARPSPVRDDQEYFSRDRKNHYAVMEYRVTQIAQPAAGVDVLAVCPQPAMWEIHSLQAQLTTDAVVANRTPHLVVMDGVGNYTYNAPAPGAQTATQTWQYSAGSTVVVWSNDSAVVLVLPYPTILLPGWKVGFKTSALDAGDQWSNVVIKVKEWLYF